MRPRPAAPGRGRKRGRPACFNPVASVLYYRAGVRRRKRGRPACFNPAGASAAPAGSIFVAGTESGVGKTVVAAAPARMAVDSGALPVVYKPFRTDDNEDMTTPIAAIQDLVRGRASGTATADTLRGRVRL